MAYELTWLPDVLLAAGLRVARQPGWESRGRARMGTPLGVMCHHTVGPRTGNMPSLDNLIHGSRRADGTFLPGPLAQLGLGRDGTYYVIAAGRCNHAGPGKWGDVVDGNSHFIGIEAENMGTPADPWPQVQLDAYVHGVAALLAHIGASYTMCCGHKEWRPTGPRAKIDPHTINMDAFRAQVRAVMEGATPAPAAIPKADAQGRATLVRGAQGEAVRALQRLLAIGDDGVFGGGTEAAVRRFQRNHALVPDGRVGPKTWAALQPG